MSLSRRFFSLLGLALFAGCSDAEPREESFSIPAGFSRESTRLATLNPAAFVRNERHEIVSSTVQSRKAARRSRQVADDARSGDPRDDFRLEAVFGASYADGMTVATSRQPRASLKVTPRQALPAAGRVRGDGALVAFEGAFPNVTSVFGGRQTKVEEFLSIPSENDIPTLAYDLTPGPDFGHFVERDGVLWAFARDGSGLFTIAPPVADDAAGTRVTGSWRLEKVGAGYTLTADIALRGLRFPVLLDPSFEVPRWWISSTPSLPSARAGAAGAYDRTQNCSVVFGGATAAFDLLGDTYARCSSDQQWSGAFAASGAPEGRVYTGMAYTGATSSVALFGGFGASSVLDDLWTLSFSCPSGSSSCSGSWTQVTKSGSWPAARYMHGAASDGANLIIWGGVSAEGLALTDTWKWDGSTWTQVCDGCFMSPRGLYGLAAASIVDGGGSRSIYSVGGYNDVSSPSGEFTNIVLRFTGTGWSDVSAASGSLPIDTGTPLVTPPTRNMHWAAATDAGNLLIGSGLKTSVTGVETYYADTWLWSSSSVAWLRTPNPTTSVGDVGPGQRESATAIFDETNRDLVLFGGLDSSHAAQQNGLVYKGQGRSISVTQTCPDANLDGFCDNNDFTLSAVLDGIGAGDCGSFEIEFLKFNSTSLLWESEALVTPTFGSTCGASRTYAALELVTYADLGVRVRDTRMRNASSGACSDTAGDVVGGGLPGCLASSGTYDGSAVCGGLVDPSIPGLEQIDCQLY